MIAGNSCNPCGNQMGTMMMVPVGMMVPGGGATPGTTPDGVGAAFDFNALTAAQKAQVVSIVQTGYDFSTLTAAQKAALIAALGIGAGGAAGVDGIAPAFDLSTLTAAQKAALVTIVAAGLDFSTLSAAQKAQIQAIAGAGTPLTAAELAAAIAAAPPSTTTGTNVPTSLPAINSAGTLVETSIVPLPAPIIVPYTPVNNASAGAFAVLPVATITVPVDGWYVFKMSTMLTVKSKGMAITPLEDTGYTLYATNVASGKQLIAIGFQPVLQSVRATVAGEVLLQARYSGPSEPFYATAGTVINTAVYTGSFVSDVSFVDPSTGSPNVLQRVSGNYLK